jgi:hypothetical protein
LNFKYMKNSMHADYFIFWQYKRRKIVEARTKDRA